MVFWQALCPCAYRIFSASCGSANALSKLSNVRMSFCISHTHKSDFQRGRAHANASADHEMMRTVYDNNNIWKMRNELINRVNKLIKIKHRNFVIYMTPSMVMIASFGQFCSFGFHSLESGFVRIVFFFLEAEAGRYFGSDSSAFSNSKHTDSCL